MMNNNNRPVRSLGHTITIAFLVLSVVTLLVSGSVTLYTNIIRQQQNISSQQQFIARNASQKVSGFFEEKFKTLESTSKIVELPKGTPEQRKLILQSLLATQPSFRQMLMIDSTGVEAADVSRVSLELSEQFRTQLKKTVADQGGQSQRYISSLYFDKITNEPVIILAIPINIWDFNGILATEVNLQFMWSLVEQLKVGNTGYVYIVTNAGNLIAAKDTARVLANENVKQISEVSEFVNNPSAVADTTLDANSYTGLLGSGVVGTYVPLGTPQWAVVTELPVSEANEPIRQSVTTSLITILIMGILAGAAGFITARRLSIPLVGLAETATRIANGEFDLQAVASQSKETVSLAAAFNTMTHQLRGFIENLEDRVAERTKELEAANQETTHRASQLQTVTELSEAIAQVQDLGELFNSAVNLISTGFGFYHVGIFLIDNSRENAIMQASNSEGGQKMLARGHRLKMGTGVVGYAAQTGQPRIALDVGADAFFFNNPDLPTTRSEVALPLRSRGETFGVLDVQSTEAGAFSNEDLQVLIALANQVSIAFENARLLSETRAALAQVQEVYDEFTRAEWSRAAVKAEQAGFRYQSGRIEMIEKSMNSPEVVSAVQTGEVATNQPNASKKKRPTVAVPVKLRGEVIGVLHIESSDVSKTWQRDEISLVEAVAERAAFAMENARLFQDARKRASKERLISEATTKISGALSLENILQTTAQELERVLGGSEVLIQFRSKEQK